MKKHAILAVVAATTLGGCVAENSFAAKKVLGDGAIVIDAAQGKKLAAPGVYKVLPNSVYAAYCTDDFAKNQALQSIKPTTRSSTDIVVDQLSGEGVSIAVPGFGSLTRPYKKTKIEGYTVTTASSPADGTFYDYVYKNVGKNCRALLDSGNFLVIEQEARATKSYKLTRGPIADKVTWGIVTVDGLSAESSTQGPSDVTFGVTGTVTGK